MAVSCPKCGKPVRPGSKFCSKCGAEMPATLPLSKSAQAAPPPQPPADSGACPKCNNPIRPGAKFCPNCGNVLSPVAAADLQQSPPSAATAQEGVPMTAPAAQPLPPPSPVKTTPQPPAAQPPKPGAKPAAAGRSGRKRWWLLVLAGILLLVCLALAVVVFFLRDRLPIPFLNGATETATLEMTATETVTPTSEVTPTDTVIPTGTATPIPSSTPTLAITGTETIGTASPGAPLVLFEDDFSAGWELNWIAWGPLPVVGGDDISLTLVSAVLKDAGIHTRKTIKLEDNLTIEFLGKLNGNTPQDVIFFDWYTGSETPNADDPPGAIHVQIGTGVVQIEIADSADTYKSCVPKSFSGVDAHIYQIEIEDDWKIKFQMDGKQVCELSVKPYTAGADATGILSFTGRGTLDDILVTLDD